MTKDELIILLKEYKENLARLKLRRREKQKFEKRLTQYKRKESNVTGVLGLNCDIHSKNQISNKTESTAIDNIDSNKMEIEEAEKRIKELKREIEVLEDKVQETNIRLSALSYKEREITCAYYVDKLTYEDIGNKTYFRLYNQTRDKDTIKRIIDIAVKKMINL